MTKSTDSLLLQQDLATKQLQQKVHFGCVRLDWTRMLALYNRRYKCMIKLPRLIDGHTLFEVLVSMENTVDRNNRKWRDNIRTQLTQRDFGHLIN